MSMAFSLARPMVSGLAQTMAPVLDGLLLDTLAVQPVAAFSLQKIRAAYTGACIRVRRSSDNAEADIGFVGNSLDTASLLTHCGAGDGFVRTRYGQNTGTQINMEQTTAGSQIRIVSAGVVDTFNGRPALKGSTASQMTAASFFGAGNLDELMMCSVSVPQAGGLGFPQMRVGADAYVPFTDLRFIFDVGGSSAPNRIETAGIGVNGTQYVAAYINSVSGSIQQIWLNGSSAASDATGQASVMAAAVEFMRGANDYWLEDLYFFGSAPAIAQRAAISANQAGRYT